MGLIVDGKVEIIINSHVAFKLLQCLLSMYEYLAISCYNIMKLSCLMCLMMI